jgi:hypothetical protein
MVFHVTNNGAELGGMGREEVLVAGVEAPSEVEEEEDEALALGARCRRLGSLRALGAVGSDSETGADNS